ARPRETIKNRPAIFHFEPVADGIRIAASAAQGERRARARRTLCAGRIIRPERTHDAEAAGRAAARSRDWTGAWCDLDCRCGGARIACRAWHRGSARVSTPRTARHG